MELIPQFIDKPNVLGIGEIGLNKNSANELKVLERHIEIAAEHDQLILVHTPHLEDKYKGTRLILDASSKTNPVFSQSAASLIMWKSTPLGWCWTRVSGPA